MPHANKERTQLFSGSYTVLYQHNVVEIQVKSVVLYRKDRRRKFLSVASRFEDQENSKPTWL